MNKDFETLQKTVYWPNPPQSEEETLMLLRNTPALYQSYQKLTDNWKQQFLAFCEGKKSLPLTYDPFFKRIFHPDIHPDRLSRFISSILGEHIKIIRVLPNEDSMVNGESYLIMDLLAELEDGSLCNIEIQKNGYAFSAERISCYSADLLMRQYSRLKGLQGKNFTYKNIKRVYVIVLYEKSEKPFHDCSDSYIHHGKNKFDTNLQINLLQEYYLIALDVFIKNNYADSIKSDNYLLNEQKAWLALLVTKDLKDAEQWIQAYPWLEEIYSEIAALRQKPEEVLNMWSEALYMLDENSLKYMVDELQDEVKKRDSVIAEKDAALAEKDSIIAQLRMLIKK